MLVPLQSNVPFCLFILLSPWPTLVLSACVTVPGPEHMLGAATWLCIKCLPLEVCKGLIVLQFL